MLARTLAPSRRLVSSAARAAIAVALTVATSVSCTNPTAPDEKAPRSVQPTPQAPSRDQVCDWVNPWVYLCH